MRSLNERYVNQFSEDVNVLITQAFVRVCLPNDIALSCMTDAISLLTEAGLVRGGVKYHIRRARQYTEKYEKILSHSLSLKGLGDVEDRYEYFMNFADSYNERMKIYVVRMHSALKRLLDRDHETDSNAKAYAVLTNILLNIAVTQYDVFWNSWTTSVGSNLRDDFMQMRLSGVFSAWRTAVEQLPFISKSDPSKDNDVTIGVETLLQQIANVDNINAAGNEALEITPHK